MEKKWVLTFWHNKVIKSSRTNRLCNTSRQKMPQRKLDFARCRDWICCRKKRVSWIAWTGKQLSLCGVNILFCSYILVLDISCWSYCSAGARVVAVKRCIVCMNASCIYKRKGMWFVSGRGSRELRTHAHAHTCLNGSDLCAYKSVYLYFFPHARCMRCAWLAFWCFLRNFLRFFYFLSLDILRSENGPEIKVDVITRHRFK